MSEPVHSPKGGSSAERWINCQGSSALLDKLKLPQTDDSEFAKEGTAAHAAAEHCLREVIDTWEIVGQKFGDDVECNADMADAVQEYLNYARSRITEGATVSIEKRIGEDPATRPHPDFYGTVDFSVYGSDELEIVDYKHGAGIVVEPENNAQMLYYAYGILHDRIARGIDVRSDRVVRLTIVQPRAFHIEGPIRDWETTAGEIIHWAETVLLPAMNAIDLDFVPGKWCRFCPAKLLCPVLVGLFGAAAKADPNAIPNFSNERLGLEYSYLEAVQFYRKALETEIYRRNMSGNTVDGTKLVRKQAKRVWKDGAAGIFTSRFGAKVYNDPAFLSPAEMEKLPGAKDLVKQWAYTPNTGLTVKAASDRGLAIKVDTAPDVFQGVIDALDNSNEATQD